MPPNPGQIVDGDTRKGLIRICRSRIMKNVVIIGGKGTALSIAEQIHDARVRYDVPLELLGFAVDDPALGLSILGRPVVCTPRQAAQKFRHSDVAFVFSLYKSRCMRERVALLASYQIPDDRFLTFVHPSAWVAPSARLDHGTIVLSNVVVQSNVMIGKYNIINSNVVIEHDSTVGNSNVVAASTVIGSEVTLGNGAFIGLNSTIREHTRLGDYCFVGMASNVVADVGPDEVVYGNPARKRAKSW